MKEQEKRTELVAFRCFPFKERRLYEQVARLKGLDLSSFIRDCVNKVVKSELSSSRDIDPVGDSNFHGDGAKTI